MTTSLSDVAGIVFDFDGTLYEYMEIYTKALRQAQVSVLIDETEGRITPEEAEHLCATSYKTLRNGYDLPAQKLGLNPYRLHELFHARTTMEGMKPIPKLRRTLFAAQKQGIKSSIASHSHYNYVSRGMDFLGITHLIDHVVTLEQVNYREKHKGPDMFKEAQRRLNVPSEKTLMVDDLPENLLHAREIGMRTDFIHWGKPRDALPGHVEFQHDTPVTAIEQVLAARRPAPVMI